jgi:hypothetical protein
MSAFRARRDLPQRRFLLLISVKGLVNSKLLGLGQLKTFKDLLANPRRELLACSLKIMFQYYLPLSLKVLKVSLFAYSAWNKGKALQYWERGISDQAPRSVSSCTELQTAFKYGSIFVS